MHTVPSASRHPEPLLEKPLLDSSPRAVRGHLSFSLTHSPYPSLINFYSLLLGELRLRSKWQYLLLVAQLMLACAFRNLFSTSGLPMAFAAHYLMHVLAEECIALMLLSQL